MGGYFEIELPILKEYYPELIGLNSARNCLKYIIKAKKINSLFVPYYTCKAILDVLKGENCQINFYSIGLDFLPMQDFPVNSWILYTDYFGTNHKNVLKITSKYKNIIIDNAQAFYSSPIEDVDTFYSPRKFFGVPDGAYLQTSKKLNNKFETDTSFNRFSHLLKRVDLGAQAGYEDFLLSEKSLEGQPIKHMSNLTRKMLISIDYMNIKNLRLRNFRFLDRYLNSVNELKISLGPKDVPMAYPLLIKDQKLRAKLHKNNIYVPTYWPEMEKWVEKNSFELYLKKYLIPLPIDQRIGINQLKKYLRLILH
ncbi:MAG: hypothetical protein ACOYUB_01325 [Patescibacteria group bacterium]